MAFRNIDIALRLQLGGFTAGLGAASAQVSAFGRQLKNDLGEAKSRDIERIGTAGLVAGGALLAGFGLAAKATLDFDKTLSDLQAVSGATGAQMDQLRQQALDAGAATTFSASEAAAAQVELAKAGVSTADILGGALDGALSLAAAGNLDLATSATFAANAMTTFGLAGDDVGHIADVLAAAANKSAVDVQDIGQALQQTGLVADQFGLTLDDTVGVLAAFGQAGLRGSDAGTSLKTMLQRLGAPTATAADEMERLGIDLFDATGNFVGIEAAAGELQDGLSGLSQEQRVAAMNTIFGADAVRAATILYEEGEEGVAGWVDAVNDAGYAEEVAAQKTDNLAGDLEALGGAIETQLIMGGSKATGALRGLTQGVTAAVTGFGELPSAVQTAGIGFAGIAGTGLAAVGVVGTMAPKVRELKTALEGMGTAGQFVSRNMGNIAGVLGLATASLGIWSYHLGQQAEKAAESEARIQGFADAIDELGSTASGVGQQIEQMFEDAGSAELVRVFDEAGISADEFADAVAGSDAEWNEFIDSVGGGPLVAEILQGVRDEAQQAADHVERTGSALGVLGDEAEGAGEDMESAAAQTDTLGGAMEVLADEAGTAEDRMTAYADAMDRIIGVHVGSFEAATAFGSAITGLTEELTNGERSLDAFTTEGQANREALSGAAQAAIDHAVAVGNETGSVEQANWVLAGHVTQLTDVMRQAGLTDQQIAVMIAQMGLTPENIQTLIDLQNYEGATGQLDSHQRNIAQTPGQANTFVNTPGAIESRERIRSVKEQILSTPTSRHINVSSSGTSTVIGQFDALARTINNMPGNIRVSVGGGGGLTLAGGGIVYAADGHPGGPRGTDTVPAWLTPGEMVLNRTQQEHLWAIINGRAGARRTIMFEFGGQAVPIDPASLSGLDQQVQVSTEIRDTLAQGFADLGKVTEKTWNELKRAGWRGKAGDKRERLYEPGMVQAAKEIFSHVAKGGRFFEDFSFMGASGTVRKFNDKIVDLLYAGPLKGFDFGSPGTRAKVTRALKAMFGFADGGVTSYQGGGIHAHVTDRDLIRYGEPGTGGEAFVPRFGNRARSMSVLEEAAGWYGLGVVDPRTTSAPSGGLSRDDLVAVVREAVAARHNGPPVAFGDVHVHDGVDMDLVLRKAEFSVQQGRF